MAYSNFIPTVWNAAIERELERVCVFAEDCNRKYEGNVKDKGETVKILGVGKPTIKSIARENRSNDIDGPEEVEDTSIVMPINQQRYFNYMVGDIDKAQSAANGIMDALEQETSEGLANEIDKYIAALALDESVPKLYTTTPKVVAKETTTTGEVYVLDVLDLAIQKLMENDVSGSTKIVMTVSPRFYTILKKAYRFEDTNNSELLKNGLVGTYGKVAIKISNNVKTDTVGDNIMIRTQRAIAFAKPLTHTEPYRPEKKFADAVKGFILFDAKVVRPKEIFNVNVKYN